MKTVLITGAASGLGWALSRQAFALGHRVILVDMNAALLASRADTLAGEDPARVTFRDLDVTDSDAVQALVNWVQDNCGLAGAGGVGDWFFASPEEKSWRHYQYWLHGGLDAGARPCGLLQREKCLEPVL